MVKSMLKKLYFEFLLADIFTQISESSGILNVSRFEFYLRELLTVSQRKISFFKLILPFFICQLTNGTKFFHQDFKKLQIKYFHSSDKHKILSAICFDYHSCIIGNANPGPTPRI